MYSIGRCPFDVKKKKIIPILNHYSLYVVENPRLQRLKEKMAPYLFTTAVWCAGKQLSIPDALSRAPVSHPTLEDDVSCADSAAHISAIVTVNAIASEDNARAEQVNLQYDQHVHPLPRLSVEQTVRIQNPTSLRWDKVGVIMSCGRSRDYEIHLRSGRVWWCNRRFLRVVPSPGFDPLPNIPVVLCLDAIKSLIQNPSVVLRRSSRLQI